MTGIVCKYSLAFSGRFKGCFIRVTRRFLVFLYHLALTYKLVSHQVRPYRISPGNGTRRPAICNSGTFTAISQSTLNTQFPMAAMGRFYISIGPITVWCSAMLIAPDTILTALHCIYNCSTYATASSGTFYHQFYNGTWASAIPAVRWVGAGQCQAGIRPLYDIAVLKLQTGIANVVVPATVRSTARAVSNTRSGSVYSYPGETKPGGIPYVSQNSALTTTSKGPSFLEVDLSIEPGSSGGPLFLNNLPGDQYRQSDAIIGVASYGYTVSYVPMVIQHFSLDGTLSVLKPSFPVPQMPYKRHQQAVRFLSG
jgi:V8-like Glu-specific endopeptidase